MKNQTHAFTKKALQSPTPIWAKNMFRIALLITSVATFIIASDASIPAETAVRIGVYLKASDLFFYGLSKMFGVEKENN